ncbi:hypothetical protein A3C67_00755 [Candidatus Nomurabacteria bacterium RIFCSPHIGHO2_02_FULL_42_19]|uniref:Uncharacterized protein n=1 Tax=Candidatus Nomurabacteria bacterium RIFCSPHIGHO2_02_FULL_42_19 TaxID=1801756 RepID=A0A1F6W1N2_9BACT|nr:MAG: hypothetical protein A3C67_00755 [Candidatus Nomurabacteria bacterium RIFCSPHIGHO2_02_FULL_42_19]
MAIHTINGHDVDFHSDTHHAESFLRHSNNFHAAKTYLDEAKEHGKTFIYANNYRYEIRHEKGEGDRDKFSIHYAGH